MFDLILKNNKVVCEVDIPAKNPIYEFTGNFYTDPSKYEDSLMLQVGSNLYMGPSGNIDDLIKHSCNPNCYIHIIGKRAILYSLVNIKANTEITFDYSISALNGLNFACKCGAFNCRKVIKPFLELDEGVRNKLISSGIVPLFIYDKRFK